MLKTVPAHSPIESRRSSSWRELVRCALLAFVALWLTSPFATNRQVGAGDALWYSDMLADFVLQWRQGIFPVFVGQTEYAFNGAVYPLRVAPLYQHIGGALDLLTAHRLGFFALQHLVVIFSAVAGIFIAYGSLLAISVRHRWSAAGLSVLYLSCPGVLGTIFTQDLYMTWVAMPFLPLVAAGIVRAFQRNDWLAYVLMSAGLALLWLAHAPIAMWMTFAAIVSQAYRLLVKDRNWDSWKKALGCTGLFIVLGSYPFISVASLRDPGAPSAVAEKFENPERMVAVLREVFPQVLYPLSAKAALLSDLQLGYGLWLCLVVSAFSLLILRATALRVLVLIAGAILLVLLPTPGLSAWFWLHAPQTVQKLTYYWPMHRLYLVLAALIVAAAQIALAGLWERGLAHRRLVLGVLIISCAWSLSQAREFLAAGESRTATVEASALRHRPENLLLMNHAYGLFRKLPAYFSNGVVDPQAEVRLLDKTTWKPEPRVSTATAQRGLLKGHLDANPGILDFDTAFDLEPGKKYELEFSFREQEYHGILQILGPSFFREYALPESGQPLAFGSSPSNSRILRLWTTSDTPEQIHLRFIPTGADRNPEHFNPFAEFVFREVRPEQQAIHVQSLVPLKVDVVADREMWLETPRMFTPGYRATVNGKPQRVQASPEGLAAIPISPGQSAIVVTFSSPILLGVSYWITLISWAVLIGTILFRLFASGRGPANEAKNLSALSQQRAVAS